MRCVERTARLLLLRMIITARMDLNLMYPWLGTVAEERIYVVVV